jgi:hypothetical protein
VQFRSCFIASFVSRTIWVIFGEGCVEKCAYFVAVHEQVRLGSDKMYSLSGAGRTRLDARPDEMFLWDFPADAVSLGPRHAARHPPQLPPPRARAPPGDNAFERRRRRPRPRQQPSPAQFRTGGSSGPRRPNATQSGA